VITRNTTSAVVLCGIAGLILALLWRVNGGQLQVIVQPAARAEVTVSSSRWERPQVRTLSSRTRSATFRGMEYGVHQVQVRFADGSIVRAEFLHHDTGAVRHQEITVERLPGNRVRLRHLLHGSELVADVVVDVREKGTGDPVRLGWI